MSYPSACGWRQLEDILISGHPEYIYASFMVLWRLKAFSLSLEGFYMKMEILHYRRKTVKQIYAKIIGEPGNLGKRVIPRYRESTASRNATIRFVSVSDSVLDPHFVFCGWVRFSLVFMVYSNGMVIFTISLHVLLKSFTSRSYSLDYCEKHNPPQIPLYWVSSR